LSVGFHEAYYEKLGFFSSISSSFAPRCLCRKVVPCVSGGCVWRCLRRRVWRRPFGEFSLL